MQNVLPEGRLKPSSNDAMANSLTDSSTETFWESRDEPRSKTKALMVTFNEDKKLYAAAIHNDNGKDSGVCVCVCVCGVSVCVVCLCVCMMMHDIWLVYVITNCVIIFNIATHH